MKFLTMQQGSDAWLLARAKRITASCFADAVSRVGALDERQAKYVALVRGGMEPAEAVKAAGYKAAPTAVSVVRALLGEDPSEPSDTAKRYAADLAIERISGAPHGEPPKAWTLERGHELEVAARMIYEARTGAFVTESGICVSDDGVFAYSSDGLVDDDGLIEIKAPIDSIKIMDMWRDGDTSEYDHQIQGGMWLTGRKWLDFIMYVPDLAAIGKDLYVKRIYRDEAFIIKMVDQLVEFDRLVDGYTLLLRADTMPITTIEETMITETPAPAAAPAMQLELTTPAPPDLIAAMNVAAPAPLSAEDAAFDAEHGGRDLAPAEQAAVEAAGAENFERSHTPPALRLGQISTRLGFTVTADFMASLGFAPAATDKAAKLYHESDFKSICAALLSHIAVVSASF